MKAKSLADAHYRPATAFSGCCRDCKNFFRTGSAWLVGRAVHFCEVNRTARSLCANVAPMMVCDKFQREGGRP